MKTPQKFRLRRYHSRRKYVNHVVSPKNTWYHVVYVFASLRSDYSITNFIQCLCPFHIIKTADKAPTPFTPYGTVVHDQRYSSYFPCRLYRLKTLSKRGLHPSPTTYLYHHGVIPALSKMYHYVRSSPN